MPEYQFYYTTKGSTAEVCERAYHHWEAIVKRNENKVWAQDYDEAPPMSGITLTMTPDKLPMLEHLSTRKKMYGEEVVEALARMCGNAKVKPQRYVMYSDESISYKPTGSAVMLDGYKGLIKQYKKAIKKAERSGKDVPVVPDYLIEGKDKLPILVTRERNPTVWYGMAAVDWARMVESLDR